MPAATDYRMPATPNACVVCGRPYDLSRQSFRFRRRSIDLPVCASCWKRHEAARMLVRIAVALAAFAAVGGIAAGVLSGHAEPVIAGALTAAVFAAPSIVLFRRRRPKLVAGEGIVLDIPKHGRVRVG